MHHPNNLSYTHNHEWVSLEGNLATVGISDFGQDDLGEIEYVDIECLRETMEHHDAFGKISSENNPNWDLFMPISGTIVAVNELLLDHPEYVNKSPYNKGWLIKVDISADANFSGLMNSEEYKKMIGS